MSVDITAIVATPELERMRSERSLRPLNKNEEGSDLYKLPGGIFGFTNAPGLKEVPVYSRQAYLSFEVQKLKDGKIHLVGFVTPDEMAKVSIGKESAQIAIYPGPWKEASVLISVADEKLQPAKKAVAREDGNPFRTLVFPA